MVSRGDGNKQDRARREKGIQSRDNGPSTMTTKEEHETKMAPAPEKHEASQSRDEARARVTRERQAYLSQHNKPLPPPPYNCPHRGGAQQKRTAPDNVRAKRDATSDRPRNDLMQAIASGEKTSTGQGRTVRKPAISQESARAKPSNRTAMTTRSYESAPATYRNNLSGQQDHRAKRSSPQLSEHHDR